MNRLSNNITTTYEGIDMIHFASSKSTDSFEDKCKYILTDTSSISGKIVHSKMKKIEDKKIKTQYYS